MMNEHSFKIAGRRTSVRRTAVSADDGERFATLVAERPLTLTSQKFQSSDLDSRRISLCGALHDVHSSFLP